VGGKLLRSVPRWDRELLSGSEGRGIRCDLDSRPRLEKPKKIDRDEGEDAGQEHDGSHQYRRRPKFIRIGDPGGPHPVS
jgi:hypothetical protein